MDKSNICTIILHFNGLTLFNMGQKKDEFFVLYYSFIFIYIFILILDDEKIINV